MPGQMQSRRQSATPSSSRSHDAVIRVYDDAGNVIETHEHVLKAVADALAQWDGKNAPMSAHVVTATRTFRDYLFSGALALAMHCHFPLGIFIHVSI